MTIKIDMLIINKFNIYSLLWYTQVKNNMKVILSLTKQKANSTHFLSYLTSN